MPDVIVTGLPRAGSTLVAALIDYLPNAVCLNMPPWHTVQAQKIRNPIAYAKWLAGDFLWVRQQLLRKEMVRDYRAANGAPLLDGLLDPRQVKDESGTQGTMTFARTDLAGDFILGMKHHILYTATLPSLVKIGSFKIIAVIRHPRDVIASWKSLPEQPPIVKGRPPGIARLWPEATDLGDQARDPLDHMVQLYDLHLQRYHELREHIHIVKYEDVVENPVIVSQLFGLTTPSPGTPLIESRSRSHIRMGGDSDNLRERFRQYGVFTRHYYPDI